MKVDGVVVAVAHNEFKRMNLEDLARIMNDNPVLIDVRGLLDEENAKMKGFYYKTL